MYVSVHCHVRVNKKQGKRGNFHPRMRKPGKTSRGPKITFFSKKGVIWSKFTQNLYIQT